MARNEDREFIRAYRKRHRVSRIRQWVRGGKTVAKEWSQRPCPECHGNDRTTYVMSSPCAQVDHCSRCDKDFIS